MVSKDVQQGQAGGQQGNGHLFGLASILPAAIRKQHVLTR